MKQLKFFKISLSLIVATLLIFGPYSDFIPFSAYWSTTNNHAVWHFVRNNFIEMKYFIIFLCFLSILPLRYSFIPVSCLAISFGVFNWFCSVDSPGGLYNYNTHLNIFLVCLAIVMAIQYFYPDKYESSETKLFQFCRCYILTFYLQSGLSKLIFAGTTWLITGNTAWVFAIELGTDFGRYIAHYPILFVAGSFIIVSFEILIFPLYLLNFCRKYLVLGAICLHLSVFLVMGISFWHMWLLYPIIFYNDIFPTRSRFRQKLRTLDVKNSAV